MLEGTLGPYRIATKLGAGGMGIVYLAEALESAPGVECGTKVAVKIIHPHLLETAGFFKRFLREAQLGQRVEHPNVVRTHDCDALLHDGQQCNFLVMEYVEGQTLRDLLDELGTVPEELCRHIASEIAKGLCAIHGAGAVHRDLKPENVLITSAHEVKIMDLGVARLQDEAVKLSQTGEFIGSLLYAAPESFEGRDLDGRADLFSLGLLLYELATGHHPFRHDQMRVVLERVLHEDPRRAGEVNPQLSPFLEEVIHTLLEKDLYDRFESAAETLTVLEEGEAAAWWHDRARTLRAETKQPLRRIRIPRETALYGRDADLAQLEALFAEARAGEGQVLVLEGEAGIGKTRLVDEFVARLRQSGEELNFLFGSYPPGGAATTAGAFSTAYREHFGEEDLEETLREALAVTPGLVPAFAALLRGEGTPSGADPLTKESLQTVFVHATRALAAERPTIVLIDDLHFAPAEGRALFSSLAMAVPGHRVLLVGTTRPRGPAEAWTANLVRLDQTHLASLARLGPKDLANLLVDAFHSERLARDLGHQIAMKSDGNPFFAFEIIRGLREGQFIAQGPDGAWATTKRIQDIQVPSSVVDLVQARIQDLDPAEKDLLDVAACCGFEFDPGLVAAAVGLARLPALKLFARIEQQHRLIRSTGRVYAFDHHQVQEALYASLHQQLREEYHGALAEEMERREGAGDLDPELLDGALCVDLCEHFLQGGRGAKAQRYLNPALAHLARGFLNDQAIRLADRVLAVPKLLEGEDRLAVLLRKNARLELQGKRDAQAAVLAEARALVPTLESDVPRAQVDMAEGALLVRTSRYDEARVCLDRALEHYRVAGVLEGQALAHAHLGSLCHGLGEYRAAEDHFRKQRALGLESGDLREEAGACGSLGILLWSRGQHEEALICTERQIAIVQQLGDRHGEASAMGIKASGLFSLGRYAEAQMLYERHLALAHEVGDRTGEAAATGNLGLIHWIHGRYDEAREHTERQIAVAREIGDRRAEAWGHGSLGSGCQDLGHYAEALEHHTKYLALARAIRDRGAEAMATKNLGSVLHTLGRLGEAHEHLDIALALTREIGARPQEASALAGLAALAVEEGHTDEGLGLAEEALAMRREIRHGNGIVGSLILLGELHTRAGATETARDVLEEALALSREQHRLTDVAVELALLAGLEGGDITAATTALSEAGPVGDTARVRYFLWKASGEKPHLEAAKRHLEFLVAHAPESDRASMVARVRLHREIAAAGDA